MNYYNGHLSEITDIFKTFVGHYQKSPHLTKAPGLI